MQIIFHQVDVSKIAIYNSRFA